MVSHLVALKKSTNEAKRKSEVNEEKVSSEQRTYYGKNRQEIPKH
jgi:hypothetical protein